MNEWKLINKYGNFCFVVYIIAKKIRANIFDLYHCWLKWITKIKIGV